MEIMNAKSVNHTASSMLKWIMYALVIGLIGLVITSCSKTKRDLIIAGLPVVTHNIAFSLPHPKQPITIKGITVNMQIVTNIGIISH